MTRLSTFAVVLGAVAAAAFEPYCRPSRSTGDYVSQLINSICSSEAACTEGTGTARGAQLGEHTYFTREALVAAGLGDFAQSQPLDYYVAGLAVQQAQQCEQPQDQLRSIEPSGTGQMLKHVTSATVAAGPRADLRLPELAQAGDWSYSLSDFLSGNEHCLALGALPDAQRNQLSWIDQCHRFRSHMGGVNSNHFSPQNRATYGLYHGAGKIIAARCKAMQTAFAGTAMHPLSLTPPGLPNSQFQRTLEACELEALSLESAGSHFFADAWSSGHMWERWGRPAFERTDAQQVRAQVVAATSGLIHGAKALLSVDDKLCMPGKFDPTDGDEAEVRFRQDGGPTQAAGGDLYVVHCGDASIDRAIDTSPALAFQRKRMITCLARGFGEVYGLGPQTHGPAAFGQLPTDVEITSPDGENCWSQRVTNASMKEGLGVNGIDLTDSRYLVRLVPRFSYWFGGQTTTDDDLLQLRNIEYPLQMAAIGLELRQRAAARPDDTDSAALEGLVLGQLLGEPRNSETAGLIPTGRVEFFEPPDPRRWSDRPVDDVACRTDVDCVQRAQKDPTSPYAGTYCDHSVTVGDFQVSRCVRQEASILRAFRTGEAAYFCSSETWDDLNSARWQCANSSIENGGKPACDACVRAVLPHLRNGCDPGSYQPRGADGSDHRSLCDVLSDAKVSGPAEPLYAPYDPRLPGDAERAARALCEGGAAKARPTSVGYLDLHDGPAPMPTDSHWAAGWFSNGALCGSNLPRADWYHYSHATAADTHLHVFEILAQRFDDFPFVAPAEDLSLTVFPGAQGCAAAAAGNLDAGIDVAPTDADGDGVNERVRYDWIVPAGTADEICIRSAPRRGSVASGVTFSSGSFSYCDQCGNCAACDRDSTGNVTCRSTCGPGMCTNGLERSYCDRGYLVQVQGGGCWCGSCLSKVTTQPCPDGQTCEQQGSTGACVPAACMPH